MKHYGIYLAYAPTVDLRHEGLGRYLAAFLKGAAEKTDVHFVLVCPSWSHDGLEDLFSSESVPKTKFKILSPKERPLVLRAYAAYQTYKNRTRKQSLRKRLIQWARKAKDNFLERTERRIVQAYTFYTLFPVLLSLIFLCVIGLALSPLILGAAIIFLVSKLARRASVRFVKPLSRFTAQFHRTLHQPKDNGFVLRLYQKMEAAESERLLHLINNLPQVRAWYSPTAFWPAFNKIQAPKLMCVPDVVLSDFPTGFASIGGDRTLAALEAIESAIHSGQNFVTYSETVKWKTLVEHYGVRANNVAVVHHAPNDLNRWINVCGFVDSYAVSHHYCQSLLLGALKKSSNPLYSHHFINGSVKFLFYASQFRPNKNVITLLRSFEYLLRKRMIGHKLILTGNPYVWPPIQKFITEHRLENDVLCLHGLKIQELAACYKLADLAVNPSLSEGGCPFTFTEALSVDTPVVMARIPVTEEVLTDPELQDVTFFDPYDWKDMADRIEWALNNRDRLLAVQRKTYAQLAQRSWTDVVNEHIEVLEQIAGVTKQSQSLETA